ncbi:MAG: hypothetical protein P1R58_01790 [bacterium]|nr:hypothetical protein [bacterium]
MKRVLFTSVLMLLLSSTAAFSQGEGIYSLDHVDGLWNSDTLNINTPIVFHIRVENNSGASVTGLTAGLEIMSPDGALWGSTAGGETGTINSSHFEQTFVNPFSITGSGADTVGFSAFRIFAPGLPDGFNDIAYTMTIGPIAASNHKKTICLDSCYFPPAGSWKWSTTAGDKFPDWSGPHCYVVFDPSAPSVSNLVITPDSLHFVGTAGATAPAPQAFDIASDGAPLSFTLDEDADWIVPSPILGTTPRTINVSINNIGVPSGFYQDTITVVAGDADNSPREVIVTMELLEPPAVISVDPGAFFFNGIAGGSNPADKIMTVTNDGGSVLDWTVSSSSAWLSLSPAFGTDSGDVTLSVDITGLGFDTYYDTIVVSDPLATNDPVLVPVTLSVGSDLPIIEIDTLFRVVTVPTGVTSIPPRTFEISNGGAGNLTFTLSENSSRILSMTPSSGSATQVVSVGFKVTSGTDGDSFFDTVWVDSPEAINSPVPVVFNLKFTSAPPQILATIDTIKFTVFECDMGANVYMPTTFFSISNFGGGFDPVEVFLQYESDYLTLDHESGFTPMFVLATAKDVQLPLGTYYDTIIVNAPVAINSPDTIIVEFVMSPGVVDPEIFLGKDSYTIPTQENSGPTPQAILEILNKFGGCMEWETTEAIPWLYPDASTGNVPGSFNFNLNSTGYPLGEYTDTFFVEALDATNSPQPVSVTMQVWRFHGDWDWNGDINILDLVANVDYLFGGGPDPLPEKAVGSLNCDRFIDIVDLTIFVSYLWEGGDIPCGNPYK